MTLSIITISYNDPEGLKRTLDSLSPLSKSLDLENIIVDSSPELNFSIINNFKRDSLVHLETPPNGIYPAFNLGLEHSRGEFIWFLNGGDRLKSLNNVLRAIETIAAQPKLDLLCAGVDFYREGKFIYSATPKSPFIKNLMGQNALCHQGIIYRRSVFRRLGSFSQNYRLAGDYEHHFRCYFAKLKTLTLPIIIAEYDRDGRSDNFKSVFREFRRIWKVYRKKMGVKLALQNESLAVANYLKLRLMKSALIRPFSKRLKDIWYRLHGQT
jgi:glycosyltransferase involved in cell wall biosynthesis